MSRFCFTMFLFTMNARKSLRQSDEETPNGFHDARLLNFTIDLVNDQAKMCLQMLVGVPRCQTEEEQEGYRAATLTLQGMVYFAIEPPDPDRGFCNAQGVFIDAGDATETDNPRAPRPRGPLPDNAFAYWFYVVDRNSFVHIAARSATL